MKPLVNKIFQKYLIQVHQSEIFNKTRNTQKMKKFGSLEQIEQDIDKGVLYVKNLVKKIGDLSKITFQQKNLFYMMIVI